MVCLLIVLLKGDKDSDPGLYPDHRTIYCYSERWTSQGSGRQEADLIYLRTKYTWRGGGRVLSRLAGNIRVF